MPRQTILPTLIALSAAILLASGCATAQGDVTLRQGGLDRTYSLHIPPGAGAGPAPLVVVMHGGLGTGAQAEGSYGWNDLADREGFVVAYPDGARRSWNAGGGCCGPAWTDGHDDIGFLDRMIADLVARGLADPDRIFLAGISNGGAMAYRFACEGTAPVAAIGSVSGAMTDPCPSPRAVSAMEIHGAQDRTIPLEGGPGRRQNLVDIQWPAADATMAKLRAASDCGPARRTDQGPVETLRWDCAQGRAVVLITIAGAGHQWPGARPHRRLGARLLDLDPPSEALDATETLWRFFSEQRN